MKASELKITDVRVADIDGLPKHMILLKVYTNDPDIVGYGEVRDASSATYAKMLKSRLVGENIDLTVAVLDERVICRTDKAIGQIKRVVSTGEPVAYRHIALARAIVRGQLIDRLPCAAAIFVHRADDSDAVCKIIFLVAASVLKST